MMRQMLPVLLAAVFVSCCKPSRDDDPPPPPPVVTVANTKPEPTAITTTPPTAVPTPINTSGAGAAYAADGLPADIPSSRSSVPTLSEWDSVPREISVSRSTPLNCETKMLREWLRVSCRPKSSTGGTPLNVSHKLGPQEDTYYFANKGITSMVTRVTRGKHAESIFTWNDKVQKLVVDWPHGNPRPVIKFTD